MHNVGLLRVRASDDHELAHEVRSTLFTEIDATRLQILECALNNLHGTLDNELARIDLSASLLSKQQTLSHLGRERNFHDLHGEDVDTDNFAALLH